ncbi:energy transducer TonB [Nostoc sp. ChiQUE01b]|uniref:energy transducer TonB n=1 Tax=Nostoc sp. ChiQUE01b TaxID=3075376 RepID=UPI002AD3F1E4|nr:energy transducer TonB [Nostoc sp. ChiQUE01b]MDZ8264313.1 energy transducer TonB [Nostoc sp. ChiQUE01b]
MSFSGITVEQRSKEVEALKSFLTYSLIGSLALHIGVLSSGISNYLTRVPTGEEEPIEVAIVDAPTAEPEKPIAEIPEEIKKEPEVIQKQPIETLPVEKIQQQEQITAVATKPQPINTLPKAIPSKPEVAVKSASVPRSPLSEDSKASSAGGGGGGGGGGGSGVGLGSGSGIAVGTSSGTGPGGGTGTGTGGGIGSGTGTGTGSGIGSGIGSGTGSGIGSGTGSGIGSGTGSGIGSGTGSGIGSGTGSGVGNRPTVATAPTAPTPPKINSSGNGNGRAACRECNAKYPEAARRRGVEGRVEVAVDTDAQGNVTNVRIARSSGNRDLDEETARQAREWKLKPAQGGRQGVSIATEFAIKGSRRSRQVQERQAQRQAQERTQQTAAANSTQENPRRRRRELTPPSSNEARATRPAISGFSRRLEPQRTESPARNSSSGARTNRSQGSARESLRRIRSERAGSNSSQQPQATTNRRRRRDNTSQNKLRDSLRRLRQQPQSQPAAPSQQ